MIIVEGPDNAGKTTLITHLQNELGIPVVISPGRFLHKDPMKFKSWVTNTYRLAQAAGPGRIVFDRFPTISEPIYGRVIRGKNLFDDHSWGEGLVRAIKNDRNVLVIYCRPDDEVILNFGEREQMDGVINNAKALIKAYDEDLVKYHNRVNYDYTVQGALDYVTNRVLAHMTGF